MRGGALVGVHLALSSMQSYAFFCRLLTSWNGNNQIEIIKKKTSYMQKVSSWDFALLPPCCMWLCRSMQDVCRALQLCLQTRQLHLSPRDTILSCWDAKRKVCCSRDHSSPKREPPSTSKLFPPFWVVRAISEDYGNQVCGYMVRSRRVNMTAVIIPKF
jgi:hypothetical protein